MTTFLGRRAAGLLLHPTSLPGAHGIGDLGTSARECLDWLEQAGMQVWQVLPIVLTSGGHSPYASPSALAGNPLLIDLQVLVDEGLLAQADLNGPAFSPDAVHFAEVARFKGAAITRAAEAFAAEPSHPWHPLIAHFRAEEPWVEDTALFLTLKHAHGDKPWWQWPAGLRDRAPVELARAREALRSEIDRVVFAQFVFEKQWQALRLEARAKGVQFLGDLPIYVDRDSVDVWSARDQFLLDPRGAPVVVSGVPPDYFSQTGQLWGNPLYDWQAMAQDGYRWWAARLKRAFAQLDVVRIDHFRAFSAYWAVPAAAPDARTGAWKRGPGLALFESLEKTLGRPLPLVAEDLGTIDDEVLALRDAVGAPGMCVLHFAFGESAAHPYLPHNYKANSIVYTGTHDNDTTLGWWHGASEHVRDHVRRYLGRDGHDIVYDLIRAALASVANTAIIPMQDMLKLDSNARMNLPGTLEGNWAWRARRSAFSPTTAERLRALNGLYGRLAAV